MTFHWVVPLVAAALNALLGVAVFLHDQRKELNRLFALLSATLVSWNLNIFLLYFLDDPNIASYWSGVFRVGTLMAAPTAAHLFLLLSGSRSRLVWGVLYLAYGLSVFLVGVNACGALVPELRRYDWGFYPVGTALYALLPVTVGVCLCLAAGVIVRVVRHSPSPRKRQQAKLWIVGAAIAWPLAMTNLLAPFGLKFYPVGNLANVAYAIFIAHGIVRYRLMDIDIVVTKGISYVAVCVLLVIPSFALALVMESWAFGVINYDFSIVLLMLFVVVGVLFPTLLGHAEYQIGRSFFREKYEYRSALRAFTRSIVRILDGEELTRKLSETLAVTLEPDRVAVFLCNGNGSDGREGVLMLGRAVGNRPSQLRFDADSAFVQWLLMRGEAVLRDEIERIESVVEKMAIEEVFRANGWEVCVALAISGRAIGILALGRKWSLDAFSRSDLDLLDTLAAEAAIAFENSRLYEELRKSRDVIQRAGRLSAIGTLAAGIAHEIRNPLVSIQTFFQLAPERLHDEEFMTSFLKLTQDEVERIGDLVAELLNFAKSPTNAFREVDVNEEVERTLTLLQAQARKGQVGLERGEDGEGAPTIYADGDQVRQVLMNLVLNAVEATDPGGVVTVKAGRVEREGMVFCRVEVRDTGCGIRAEVREDIFNPFFTTKSKGTGLGLSIAQQIVNEHGGFILVESEVGKGSSFLLHLPAENVCEETNGMVASGRG